MEDQLSMEEIIRILDSQISGTMRQVPGQVKNSWFSWASDTSKDLYCFIDIFIKFSSFASTQQSGNLSEQDLQKPVIFPMNELYIIIYI